MNINAKLAYLLCTCSKFNDAFMAAMSKQYEICKTVATRHYFTLCITLGENNPGTFNIASVDFKFANSSNKTLADVLQMHNNKLLSWEMQTIYENLQKQNINLDTHQLIGVYTIASLIKYYRNAGFKYVFIPIIINYGRGGGILHQAALIIDFDGIFLFYEPYGKYTKYEKSYAEAVCQFFHIFDNCDLFKKSQAILQSNPKLQNYNQCDTYHSFLGLDDTNGIQTIIMDINNSRFKTFDIIYNQLIKEIKETFPTYKLEPYDDAEQDKKDHTYKILRLLSNIDESYIDKSPNISPDDKIKYNTLFNRVLECYCCYNSKTCVTITLVELNEFFKHSSRLNIPNKSNINNIEPIRDIINNLHSEFKVANPNAVLMRKLNNLMNVFQNSDDIIDIVHNSTHISKTCAKLFS